MDGAFHGMVRMTNFRKAASFIQTLTIRSSGPRSKTSHAASQAKGIVAAVSDTLQRKAELPIDRTDDRIVTDDSKMHPLKVQFCRPTTSSQRRFLPHPAHSARTSQQNRS